MLNENEFVILESGHNQAMAITIIRQLEQNKIPFKETMDGIVVLMDRNEFDKKIRKKYE